MRVCNRTTLSLIFVATLALIACGESSGPKRDNDFSGTFTLTGVNGQLPYTVAIVGFGDEWKVVSGRIRVLGRGRVLDVVEYQLFPRGGQPPESIFPDSGAFAYQIKGDLILVDHPHAFPPASWVDTAVIDLGRTISLTRRLLPASHIPPLGRYVATYEKQ